MRFLGRGDEIEGSLGYLAAIWDCRNECGEEVDRGIYVYLATTTTGQKKVGKIAVIR